MTINRFMPIQQMNSLEATKNVVNETVKAATTSELSNTPFAQLYNELIDNVKSTQAQTEQDEYDLAMGNVDDLHTVMINAQKYQTALQLTVNVTNKCISAYNEIMKMNI